MLLIETKAQRYIYVEEENTVCTVMFLFKLSHKLCCGLVIQLPSIVLKHIRKKGNMSCSHI